MALHDSEAALDGPALASAHAIHLYGDSVLKHGGGSPYLYPQYGLSSLPEVSSSMSPYAYLPMLTHSCLIYY